MQNEHQIIKAVYAAKNDAQKADEFIRSYVPFIRSETAKFMSRHCTDQDDEFSIAMIAFHEAIIGYSKNRGAFLSYASLLIRNRLIDYQRKESRHRGHISLYEESKDDNRTLADKLADSKNHYDESVNLEATQQEIEELASVMSRFGVTFSDVADNSPKQGRTLDACISAVQYAAKNKRLLEELLSTGKLPLAELVQGCGVARKTLERHRKYLIAMLLIQTNGYEIIRGHLRHVLKKEGGLPL